MAVADADLQAMLNDDSLRTLLDHLAVLRRREDQLAFLRAWLARAMQVQARKLSGERAEETIETLGKLGGG